MVDDELKTELQQLVVEDDGFSRAVMVRIRAAKRHRYAVFACAMSAGVMLSAPGMTELTAWMTALGSALPSAQELTTLAAATPVALYAAIAGAWLLAEIGDS